MVGDLIPSAHQISEFHSRRTLRAATPYYTVSQNGARRAVLGARPKALLHLGRIDQKIWKQYQTYLGRTTPLERAELYARQMRERGLRSAPALARALGEERHVVRRFLRLLELPQAIRQYLAEHRTPQVVRYFTEARLRELLRIPDARAALRRFREMVAEADRQEGIWRGTEGR